MIKLKYTGDGRFIIGIPARDLTDFDVARLTTQSGYADDNDTIVHLIATGIYEQDEQFICTTCGKECKSHKVLIKHELTHINTVEENSNGDSINRL